MPEERPQLAKVVGCLARELNMRKSFYKKPACRMNEVQKEEEIAAMAEALRLVEALRGLRTKLLESENVQAIAMCVQYACTASPAAATRFGITPAMTEDEATAAVTTAILAAMK